MDEYIAEIVIQMRPDGSVHMELTGSPSPLLGMIEKAKIDIKREIEKQER